MHGDLWSGNVFWRTDDACLIDPSAHAGHPEEDLAMLSLFGAPRHSEVLTAYETVRPLPTGWQHRTSLFQVYPLLVHAALFGGHYGGRAASAAARYL